MDSIWAERIEAVKNRLNTRIQRLLHELRQAAKDAGWKVGGIADMTDEEFSWSFIVHIEDPTQGIEQWCDTCFDVKFTISESTVHDGNEDGINFRLEFSGNGGRSYNVIAPYNYTPEVWVNPDDTEAVNTRLTLLETDALAVMECALDEHLQIAAKEGWETMQHNPHQTIDFAIARRLRERGLALPIGANYADDRLKEIAEEQHQLMQQHAELDKKLERIAKGALE